MTTAVPARQMHATCLSAFPMRQDQSAMGTATQTECPVRSNCATSRSVASWPILLKNY